MKKGLINHEISTFIDFVKLNVIMLSLMLLRYTIVKWFIVVYDNSVDSRIDRRVLTNAAGAGQRHFRLRKPSEQIKIAFQN